MRSPCGTFAQALTIQSMRGQSITSWNQAEGTVTRVEGTPNKLELGAASKTTQTIRGQYAGFTFKIDVDAEVTGGNGVCRAYVEYCSGTATTQNPVLTVRGQSVDILFSSRRETKSLTFTIEANDPTQAINVNHMRVVIETGASTTASVYEVKMFMVND